MSIPLPLSYWDNLCSVWLVMGISNLPHGGSGLLEFFNMSEGYRNASASSSSSLNSSLQDTEDDQTIASILAEEEKFHNDGRLAKRLSHLDSIPHTPRVNGEIPDVNDATFDHERLSERLATYGLAELQMEGDGNCQFRALADQLFLSPDYHKHVRRQIVKQLKHSRKLYEGYVPMKYKGYLKKMKNAKFSVPLDLGNGEIMSLCKQLRTDLEPKFVYSPLFETLATLRSCPNKQVLLEVDVLSMSCLNSLVAILSVT
ncbi:hypothetical protein CRYUN_Cryun14cG0153400 [Craigia yunnanensis]